MKPYKTVIYSFLLGGLFAIIAQTILSLLQTVLVNTPLDFFMGGGTLVCMGIIGCILGGMAIYQYFEEWATFGALAPFSGFAMAVGMKGVGPWTKEDAPMSKCVIAIVWFVIWFNVLFAAICIVFGYVCGMAGVPEGQNLGVAKTEGGMLFFWAYIIGGCIAAVMQILYIIGKKITPKCKPVHILMIAWCLGAVLAPMGISGALANLSGEGFSVMITVGGYNMYNVGLDLFYGEVGTALLHLGSFMLAVSGLAITALCTLWIYNGLYGRKPLGQVHLEKAEHAAEEAKAMLG